MCFLLQRFFSCFANSLLNAVIAQLGMKALDNKLLVYNLTVQYLLFASLLQLQIDFIYISHLTSLEGLAF